MLLFVLVYLRQCHACRCARTAPQSNACSPTNVGRATQVALESNHIVSYRPLMAIRKVCERETKNNDKKPRHKKHQKTSFIQSHTITILFDASRNSFAFSCKSHSCSNKLIRFSIPVVFPFNSIISYQYKIVIFRRRCWFFGSQRCWKSLRCQTRCGSFEQQQQIGQCVILCTHVHTHTYTQSK